MTPVQITLCDANRLFCESLCSALNAVTELRIIAIATNKEELLSKLVQQPSDVVLLEAALPPEPVAVELTRLILSYFPNTKIVILGSPDTLSNVLNCIEAGASGYVSKGESLQGLAQALQQSVLGEMPISTDLTVVAFSRLAELSRRSGKIEMLESTLTLREIKVVKLIAEGQTNKQIAECLSLSVHTVKNHVHNILEKLAIRTRAEAAKYIAGRQWFAIRKTPSAASPSSGRRGQTAPAAQLPIRRRPAD